MRNPLIFLREMLQVFRGTIIWKNPYVIEYPLFPFNIIYLRSGEKMDVTRNHYRQMLKEELENRTARNPRYSLRAFAKSLLVDVAALSRVLSNKQTITLKTANKIVDRLGLPEKEKDFFIVSVIEDRKALSLKREKKSQLKKEGILKMNEDLLQITSELHHFSILELTHIQGFNSNPVWIAKKLGISEPKASLAVERLIRLGFLVKNEKGLKKVQEGIPTAHETSTYNSQHKKYQRETLCHGLHSLENDPITQRNFQATTIAIDTEKMEFAKKMIQDFMSNLAGYLEKGEKKEVYQLSVGLFPLTKEKTMRA
jgi:uncharacterized protein (TIGR02147 family)